MKSIFFFFVLSAGLLASPLSKQQINLLNQIEVLSAQEKTDLLHAQQDYLKVEGQLNWYVEDDTKQAQRGDLWEHRTEVVVEIGAFFFTLYVGTVIAGLIIRNFPAVEGWIASVVAYALCFFASMYVLNHFIDEIGKLIPTVPSWDEATRWFHHAKQSLR